MKEIVKTKDKLSKSLSPAMRRIAAFQFLPDIHQDISRIFQMALDLVPDHTGHHAVQDIHFRSVHVNQVIRPLGGAAHERHDAQ